MYYTRLLVHIVIRTAQSVPAITESHEAELYSCMKAIVREQDSVLLRIGGTPDHVHLLVQMPPTKCLSDLVRAVKSGSSMFASSHEEWYPQFCGWANPYCAVTHSYDTRDAAISYIKSQKSYHKKVKFQDEMERFFQELGLEDELLYFLNDPSNPSF